MLLHLCGTFSWYTMGHFTSHLYVSPCTGELERQVTRGNSIPCHGKISQSEQRYMKWTGTGDCQAREKVHPVQSEKKKCKKKRGKKCNCWERGKMHLLQSVGESVTYAKRGKKCNCWWRGKLYLLQSAGKSVTRAKRGKKCNFWKRGKFYLLQSVGESVTCAKRGKRCKCWKRGKMYLLQSVGKSVTRAKRGERCGPL